MSERCHAMEWVISRVSCKTTKCTSRCCRGTGGPSRAQDRQLRDRASLFVMGNQCSGPNRIELTSGTWLSPAHISLAALNRPGFLSGGHFPYLTHATLPLQATPAEQDALRFPLLCTHRNMIQDEKRILWRAFSRKAKDAPRQGGRGHDQ